MVIIFFYYKNKKLAEKAVEEFLATPTLEEYLAAYPRTKKHNTVACYGCESTNIYMLWINRVGIGAKKHICRVCGKTLWRSD